MHDCEAATGLWLFPRSGETDTDGTTRPRRTLGTTGKFVVELGRCWIGSGSDSDRFQLQGGKRVQQARGLTHTYRYKDPVFVTRLALVMRLKSWITTGG
jgi:hypothetical protein